jgi:hypothetical protein
MPMRYAVQADVLRDLKIKETDTAAIAEVVRIENAICANLDRKMGRSFGTPSAVTVRIEARDSLTLLLPYPFRDVQSVTLDGEVLAGTDWEPWFVGPDGATAIRLTSTAVWPWYGVVEVSGIPYDAPIEVTTQADIPVDISVVAGLLTADHYRIAHSSPTNEMGPDGLVTGMTRNLWNYQIVKEAIRAHQVRRRKVAV